eukprot:scaffold4338_cov45-Phaeocystis_antarctica.AAC.1
MGYPNYDCPCSEVILAGTNVDGTYSLIPNPEFGDNNGKPVFQASSGKYLYSLWNQVWAVGDDYTSSRANQFADSTVDCPTDIAAWSVTCTTPTPPAAPSPQPLPPLSPPPPFPPPSPPGDFMGYSDYNCPCSEITLEGARFSQLNGVYSLVPNPQNSINNGKPVYQHSTALVNNKPRFSEHGFRGRLPHRTRGLGRHMRCKAATAALVVADAAAALVLADAAAALVLADATAALVLADAAAALVVADAADALVITNAAAAL